MRTARDGYAGGRRSQCIVRQVLHTHRAPRHLPGGRPHAVGPHRQVRPRHGREQGHRPRHGHRVCTGWRVGHRDRRALGRGAGGRRERHPRSRRRTQGRVSAEGAEARAGRDGRSVRPRRCTGSGGRVRPAGCADQQRRVHGGGEAGGGGGCGAVVEDVGGECARDVPRDAGVLAADARERGRREDRGERVVARRASALPRVFWLSGSCPPLHAHRSRG